MDRLEGELRSLLAEDAERIAPAVAQAERVRDRVRRQRRLRLAWSAAGFAVTASTVVAGVVTLGVTDESHQPVAATSQPGRSGPLLGPSDTFCAFIYTPSAATRRAFAFDGTVTDIAEPDGPGGDWTVTFAVVEWFSGPFSDVAVIDMGAPTGGGDEEGLPAYAAGTRLLVSGDASAQGTGLQAIGCGFTRYYDEDTAARWRAAFGSAGE